MQKKSSNDMFEKIVASATKFILGNVGDLFSSAIKSLQEKVERFFRKLAQKTVALVLLTLSLIMIVVSVPFLLSHYLDLPASLFTLCIGLIVLIISILILSKK